jgi:glucose/galactose transporter
MGICNKVAGMIGILVLVQLLFSDTQVLSEKIASLSGAELENELDVLATRLITPYLIMAIVLAGLSIMVLKAHMPEINPEEDTPVTGRQLDSKEKKSIFDFPHLVLGILCLFVYVGVEVIAIDTIGLYGQYQGFDLNTASKFGIYSLIALTIGYLLGIVIIPKHLSQKKALMICAVLGFVFVIAAIITEGWVSIGFIVLLSFANSLMWPSIWPLALDKLGRFTKTASALLIMGVVGGALIPLIYGALADSTNRQMAYFITLPCYLYIFFYAVKGHKAGQASLT